MATDEDHEHDAASDSPTLDDHPGLDNDEATAEGKMMTAAGSTGSSREPLEGHPMLQDHPGLDNDEATAEGKMLTAEGSIGPDADKEGRQ